MPVPRSQSLDYLLVLAAAVLFYSPILLFGMPYGHDGSTYAGWLLAFEHDLAEGAWYPRWLASMAAGAGSPAFFFYPPLVYYVIAATDFLADLPANVFHRIGIGVFPFFAASGLCFYWAVRPWLGRAGALCGALAYLVLPYHYGVDLWFRADFAEFAGYAWAPLCFGFLWRLDRPAGAAGLAVSFALLVVTHLPSAVILGLGLGVLALWRSRELESRAVLIRFGAAMAVGVLLSGVYLLPALTLQDFTSMHRMWLGGMHFSKNFLLIGPDPNLMPIQIALTAATFAVLLPVALPGPDGHSRRVLALLGAVAAVWVMMLPTSYPVWKLLPFLQKIQFPWRFGILLDIVLATLAGAAAAGLYQKRRVLPALLATVGLLVITGANARLVYAGHYFQEPFAAPVTVEVMHEALKRRRDSGEYLPPWAKEAAPAGPQVEVMTGDAEVSVEEWRSRDIRLGVTAMEPAELLVHQYYIPLWRASLEDGRSLAVEVGGKHGLVKMTVPPGSHRISLQLARAPAELWGLLSSLIGLVGLALLYALSGSRFFRTAVAGPAPVPSPQLELRAGRRNP